MKSMLYKAVIPLAFVVVIAGCGGDGGSGYYPLPPVATTPPATMPPAGPGQPAVSAYDKFIAYVQGLVVQALDTADPADVTAYDPPPTSETNEPVATQ